MRASTLDGGFVIEGRELPSLKIEPLMPPENDVNASAVCFQSVTMDRPEGFWNWIAELEDRELGKFCRRDRGLRETMAKIPFPEGADLAARLRAAHDWLATTVRSRSDVTAEEKEAAPRPSAWRPEGDPVLSDLVARGEASAYEMDLAFILLARTLGAEAHLVLAADRREGEWNPAIRAFRAFDDSYVAVRPPGALEGAWIFVDPGSGLPFGQIPWWLSGRRALLVDQGRARIIPVPESAAEMNVVESVAEIAPGPGGVLHARWRSTASGQAGMEPRREIRALGPVERRERLEGLCGGSAEVVRAEAPGIEERTSTFVLECERTLEDLSLVEEGPLRVPLVGPWTSRAPELVEPIRTHPVVFPYPRTDRLRLDIEAPEGLVPSAPPEPLSLGNEFGSYRFDVTVTGRTVRVDRQLTLLPREVPPYRYDRLKEFLDVVRRKDLEAIEFARHGGGGS